MPHEYPLNVNELCQRLKEPIPDYSAFLAGCFSSYSQVPKTEKSEFFEQIFWHARDNGTLATLLESAVQTGFIDQTHTSRQKQKLDEIITELQWIPYTARFRQLEECDVKEGTKEVKNNTAEYWAYDNLLHNKNKPGYLIEHSLQVIKALAQNDSTTLLGLIHGAFSRGHNLAQVYIFEQDFGWLTEKSVFNMPHEDTGYKPALQKTKAIFEQGLEKRLKKMQTIGILTRSDSSRLSNLLSFEEALLDQSFNYLLAMPFVEEIQQIPPEIRTNKVDCLKKVANILYEATKFGFHLGIKETVEKDKEKAIAEYPETSLDTYRQFHNVNNP